MKSVIICFLLIASVLLLANKEVDAYQVVLETERGLNSRSCWTNCGQMKNHPGKLAKADASPPNKCACKFVW
uniref:Uncharacterized protein n=1 Tax=Strigamia maritima TaxID=126957 RepID=T1J9W2_STRMM